VRPEDVPLDLWQMAEMALATKCISEDAIDDEGPECDCPSDEQIKIIIAAALTELTGQIERETEGVDTISVRHMLGRLKGGEGHD
jgi:hypothetical protein